MTDQADVAKWLRAIEDMATRLEARAIDRAGDSGIPGGDAMVNLAVVGSVRDQARRIELREEVGDYDTAGDDPEKFWPAVQILWWWTEDYRQQLGMDYDDPNWRPTLTSEAGFLRNRDVSDWIWNNEVKWDDYAADVKKAHDKLESVLLEGERPEVGVPCLYEKCKGARLKRWLEPYRDENGEKAWRWGLWKCPKNAEHTWTEDRYASMVTAAHEATKVEDVQVKDEHQTWCTVDYAARNVDRSVKTIRTWVNRDELATLCLIAGRRLPFVSLEEVQELAKARPTRKRAEHRPAV